MGIEDFSFEKLKDFSDNKFYSLIYNPISNLTDLKGNLFKSKKRIK